MKRPDLGSPKEIAGYSDKLWRSYDGFYNAQRRRWERVIDYLHGRHWVILDAIDLEKQPEWKRFPIIGLTLGIYSDILAQWLQSKVRFTTVPTSADYEDVYCAELGEGALKYAWEVTEADARKIELGAWLLACGCATALPYWNTDTGELIPLATKELDAKGQPTGNLIPVNPTTLRPDATMPAPVMVDKGELALDIIGPDLARWGKDRRAGVMIGQLLTEDDAEERFGTGAKKLRFQTYDAGLDLSWAGMPRLRSTEDKRCLVIRHFLPRSFRHPNGAWWEASGDQLLTGPYPLPGKRIPAVPFRWIPVPGYHALGLSPLFEVTHANKAKDEARAREREWQEKVVPKVLLKAGGNIAKGEMDNEPFGEVAGVQPGAEPSVLAPPSFPIELTKMDQDAQNDALFVAGYPFQRQSQLPEGLAKRGTRQPKTIEGNEAKLALLTTGPAWQELGRVYLAFIGAFYTDERTVQIMGPDRTYQWLSFKGSDIANLAASVRVEEIPLYPFARQALRENVAALLDSRGGQIFFQGPDGQLNRERLDLAAEAMGVDVALSTLDPDISEARNEISRMRRGEPLEYRPWQNSAAHLQEKLKVIKSMAFRGWPQEGQQALWQNIQQHQQALAQQQEQEEQKLLKQELILRTIRAQVQTEGAVKEELASTLLEIVKDIIMPSKGAKPPTPPARRS